MSLLGTIFRVKDGERERDKQTDRSTEGGRQRERGSRQAGSSVVEAVLNVLLAFVEQE